MLALPQNARKFVLVVVSAVSLSAAANATAGQRGDCGRQGTTILYDKPAELEMACEALADIIGYFGRIGFAVVPNFTLSFADHPSGPSTGHLLSHGHFDARSREVVIHRSSEAKPWGMPWSREIAASILRHELVHAAIWQIVGHNGTRLSREWHEFVAYAVQFALMDKQLRDRILARHADVHPVGNLNEVNEFTYGMNPEAFAVPGP